MRRLELQLRLLVFLTYHFGLLAVPETGREAITIQLKGGYFLAESPDRWRLVAFGSRR
jgi:hypothetical protein